MNIEIIELSKRTDLIDKAIDFVWNCWGNEDNYNFYKDCISNSLDDKNILPKFYFVLDNDKIIGTYALLTNDLISRQDLFPWFACLYVNESHRKRGIAGQLLKHGLNEAKKKGFNVLYLSTDLEEFYEKYDWTYITDGFNISNRKIKIYSKTSL
ncbi:MAG: GNAT family N-acetyltransferase [Bacteroidales bacterium]|nr:GNAT family N-acetyltransferase [Bacteroidales bacterium]